MKRFVALVGYGFPCGVATDEIVIGGRKNGPAARDRRRRVFPLLCAALLALACGQSPSERRAEIYDLRASPTADNVERLRKLLADPDRDVRATALNALVGMRVDDAGQLALTALGDQDGFVRATAAKLAADVEATETIPLLAQRLLDDADPVVRQRAAEALARFGGEAAAGAMRQALGDPAERVRMAAVSGVRRLGPDGAIEPLTRMVLDDGSWEIRVQAAEALGRADSSEVVAVLQQARTDDNEYVRAAAVNALRVHEALAAGAGANRR